MAMIEAVIERCAGIDVGRKFVVVCTMIGEANAVPRYEIRKFLTLNHQLEQLREWLHENQCTHVVMESTGSYWKPIFHVLDDGKLQVVLANSQHVKNLRGHKTDRNDSRWLAHLLRHGMIRPSFIPSREVRELRDLTRRRKQLIHNAVDERNRVQRVLQEANVQRLIRHSMRHLAFLEDEIAELDAEIVRQTEVGSLQPAMELVETIPGIKQTAAAALLAETGPDMSQFPTPPQLPSWIGVSPGNNESAGKRKSGRTTKGNPWARQLLVECAWSATRKKDSATQRLYDRLKPRLQHKRALVAVAHWIALQIHTVLSTGKPYQADPDPDLTRAQALRLVRHHSRRLRHLHKWMKGQSPSERQPASG
jgi:transposase